MPYIEDADRERVLGDGPKTAGELNFAFTYLILEYIDRKGENYQTLNDVMGALEGAKLELYRREIAPYEDTKIKKNGDVY
jgi:hypothetical protein